MDGIPLGIYDDLYIGFLEGSNDGIIDSNLEGLLLGVWLVSVDGIELGLKEGTELGSSIKRLDTTLKIVGWNWGW